eukprot:10326161-Ditylum_brightwellii.AAC.1
MSITIRDILETLKGWADDAREEVAQQEKQQTLKALHTFVGQVWDDQSMTFESREDCKQMHVSREGREGGEVNRDQDQDFMDMARLGITGVQSGHAW